MVLGATEVMQMQAKVYVLWRKSNFQREPCYAQESYSEIRAPGPEFVFNFLVTQKFLPVQ